MPGSISFADLEQITDGWFGTYDVACPMCGPSRRSAVNRRRPVSGDRITSPRRSRPTVDGH